MPIPNDSDFIAAGVTEGGFKAAFSALLGNLRNLLGTSGLAVDARAALGLGGMPVSYNSRGNWATGTVYAVNDVVVQASVVYVSQAPHVATIFTTDLAAGYWTVLQGVTFDQLAAGSGSGLIGWLQRGLGAVLRNLQAKAFETVSVLDFIPVSEHAAIAAYTSTLDVSDCFNLAIAASPWVKVPAGGYRTLKPINMSARGTGLTGRHLVGEGADRTRIDSYTGIYPCIDCTGQNTGSVAGLNFRSDNPPVGLSASDCASIGLQMGRGSVTQSCNQLYLFDLRFNLTSDTLRNAGSGTVGIVNDGAEHVIADQIQIYANLPLASHNGLQFAIARSASIPATGANYEAPYSGAAISCTIHEWRNMQLIAWDSFRAMWLHQVAGVEFPNLYTSTRKLVSELPAQKESFYLTGSCANVLIRCYQEASGLFGSVYRMDHRYLTYSGDNENLDIAVQRGVNDYGFTRPDVAEPSVMCLNAGYLANSKINCNYTIGTYNASGDNNGFAALPVAITGVPNGLRNVDFTLDHSGSHSADIFSVIGPYCANVNSRNYFIGDDYWGSSKGIFTPALVGLTTAGVATYTFQAGLYNKVGRVVTFTLTLAWTAHSGTGGMQITGLPFVSTPNLETALSVSYDGLAAGVFGRQVVAKIPNGQAVINLLQTDANNGALLGVQIDTAVPSLTVSGSYLLP